nr:MAG TPA: hypothetical protein [Caudoviricetes sp.]
MKNSSSQKIKKPGDLPNQTGHQTKKKKGNPIITGAKVKKQ